MSPRSWSASPTRRRQPPQWGHVKTSMANARCIKPAQLPPGERLFAGAPSGPVAGGRVEAVGLSAMRPYATTRSRHRARGANSPWQMSRLVSGRGVIAASRSKNSSGSKSSSRAPSDQRSSAQARRGRRSAAAAALARRADARHSGTNCSSPARSFADTHTLVCKSNPSNVRPAAATTYSTTCWILSASRPGGKSSRSVRKSDRHRRRGAVGIVQVVPLIGELVAEAERPVGADRRSRSRSPAGDSRSC